jgi:hypothetical protein
MSFGALRFQRTPDLGRVAFDPPPPLPAETITVTLDATGGTVTTPDGRIRLDVPPRALRNPARFSITPRAVAQPATSGSVIEFDLSARDVVSDTMLSTFGRPITLTVNLQGLIDLEHVPSDMYVALYYRTPEGNQNPVWPIRVNREAGTISAQVDHFSSWGAGLYPGTPGVWEFNYTAPEVSLYSGAATVQIPLKAPAGRKGLQPSLGLSYNSATLNGLTGAELGSLDWTRGSALGGFWELEGIPKIAREKWEKCHWSYVNGAGQTVDYDNQTCLRDVFTLIIDGAGYELEPVTPAAQQDAILNVPTRYYAVGAPNLYIERHTPCSQYDTKDGECTLSGGNGGSPANETKEYWIVRSADGVEFRLGYNIDSEQVAGQVCNPHWWGEEKCRVFGMSNLYGMGYKGEQRPPSNSDIDPYRAARAWWADRVTDQFGNTMEFTYGTWFFNNGERVTPRTIKYNSSAGGYLTRIELVGADANPPNNEPTIDRVDMFTKDASGVERLVRRYWFTRAWFDRGKWDGDEYIWSDFEVLSSVQEESGSGIRLPAQSFTYEWRSTRDVYDIMQLKSVANGYGGVTTFTYIDCEWGRHFLRLRHFWPIDEGHSALR